MFFSANDVGEMAQMVYNWEHDEVDAVVVSDGSRYNIKIRQINILVFDMLTI